MLEDKEIQNLLYSISPALNDIMKELYTEDVLNFKEHDESNYDVDRLDYLNRDSLYLGFITNLKTLHYESICVDLDKNNTPKCNSDNSICVINSGENYIDVYNYCDLEDIENFLLLREERYKNLYFFPAVQSYESCISNFFKAFLSSESECGKELKDYITGLKNTNVEDLDKFLNFDEITLYSELIDIAENHENKDIQDLATMLILNMSAFLTLIYSYLNLNDKKQSYSEYDKNFLIKIKSLINSNSPLKQKLINESFIDDNIIFLPENTPSLQIGHNIEDYFLDL